MKIIKIVTSVFLLLSVLFTSGCFLTKAGNYVADKSKSAYNSTKSALGFDQEEK